MWDTRSWPSEVICLCDYNIFEVVCPFGIPAHDLPRSFVCAGYQLMTFWGRLSVRDIGLQPFWGRLSLWNNSLWPSEVVCLCGISDYDLFKVVCLCGISDYDLFKVVCPCGIPAYDLLRSFVCAGYQRMIFWGRLSLQNTSLWPFEVVCPCGIPAYDLLRSFVCAGNTSLWPFEVICLWITTFLRSSDNSLWPSEVICLCRISDYDLFEVVWEYQLMTLRSFVCAEHWIYDLLRSFVCVVYCIDDLWGHLFLRNHWIVTFLRSFVYVWIYLLLRRIIHPCV